MTKSDCPICRRSIFCRALIGRTDSVGRIWCKPCTDEFDAIDWDEDKHRPGPKSLDEGGETIG